MTRPRDTKAIARVIAGLNGSKVRNKDPKSLERELRIGRIQRMLEDAGVKYDAAFGPDSLSPVNPDSLGGICDSLNRLVYDDSNENAVLPWFEEGMTAERAKRFVMKLRVPEYAEFFKRASASKIIAPNTLGMITASGEPNKDLSQLISPPSKPKHNSVEKRIAGLAIEVLKAKIIARLSTSSQKYYEIVDGKVRLNEWSLNDFQVEMAKAISHSTPGYPYNGKSWTEDHEGKPVYEHVFNDGYKILTDPNPFIFLQGARYTGDGENEGQQRLVMQAPANEKLIGHIISYPIKEYIKYPGSGQNGIQAASAEIRSMARGEYNNFAPAQAKPNFFMENDVSKWDAHIQDHQVDIFKSILYGIYDLKDDFTKKCLDSYFACFDARYLVTAMGGIYTRMLPSGSAITTIFAFLIHECYVIEADISFCCPEATTVDDYNNRSTFGFVSVGLQGDDLWALAEKLEILGSMKHVYSLYGCVMKEGSRSGSLDQANPCMVFLNELIHLKYDVPNVVCPKWNFFYAESADQNYRSISLDRSLFEEISSRVAHVTPVELTFARFVGKLQRFSGMDECFNYMVRYCYESKGKFELRSWLGERTFDSSNPVIQELERIENEVHHIQRPDEIERIADRHECSWLDAKELMAAAYLSMASSVVTGKRGFFQKMKGIAQSDYKTARQVKRITAKHVSSLNVNDKTPDERVSLDNLDLALNFFEAVSQKVMTELSDGYHLKREPDEASEEEMQPTEKEPEYLPVIVRTATSSLLSAACVDPWAVKLNSLNQAVDLWSRDDLSEEMRTRVIQSVAVLTKSDDESARANLEAWSLG